MKRVLGIILVLLLAGCAGQNGMLEERNAEPSKPRLHLESGYRLLQNRQAEEAIREFDQAILLCAPQYDSNRKIYASRGAAETLFYMLQASVEEKEGIAFDTTCSDALYFKAYASLDLGQTEVAEEYIKRAIDMAPLNSVYLSELGHIYQTKGDWRQALEIFTRSEEAADIYSPPRLRIGELTRAKRGIGYSLIELGELDSAVAKYRECLELDSNDQGALDELKYIEYIRHKKGQVGF